MLFRYVGPLGKASIYGSGPRVYLAAPLTLGSVGLSGESTISRNQEGRHAMDIPSKLVIVSGMLLIIRGLK